ncbi:hypothetical protein ES707_03633 [subsurface metagenome]
MGQGLAERYQKALHAMQTGVAFMMNYKTKETEPKHLRVGVNASMCDQAGLVEMLIEKGIITREEYMKAIVKSMEAEVDRYGELIAAQTGLKPDLV